MGQSLTVGFGWSRVSWGGEWIAATLLRRKGGWSGCLGHFNQYRLIKELRLAGVTTLEDVSRFLAAYLPRYSQRFTVPPVRAADLHRPRLTAYVLERSLCIKTSRCLRKDFTVAHQGRLYKLTL